LTYNRIPNIVTDFAVTFMTAKWMFLVSSMVLFLFVADSVANVGLGNLTRQIIPLFFVELLVLIIISFVPVTVTGLPRLFGF